MGGAGQGRNRLVFPPRSSFTKRKSRVRAHQEVLGSSPLSLSPSQVGAAVLPRGWDLVGGPLEG